jgi:hypothetical protein
MYTSIHLGERIAGLLTVTDISCSNLVFRRPIVRGGNITGMKLKAYVALAVAGVVKTTSPKPRTTVQDFSESFNFVVKNVDFDVLRMTIEHKGICMFVDPLTLALIYMPQQNTEF